MIEDAREAGRSDRAGAPRRAARRGSWGDSSQGAVTSACDCSASTRRRRGVTMTQATRPTTSCSRRGNGGRRRPPARPPSRARRRSDRLLRDPLVHRGVRGARRALCRGARSRRGPFGPSSRLQERIVSGSPSPASRLAPQVRRQGAACAAVLPRGCRSGGGGSDAGRRRPPRDGRLGGAAEAARFGSRLVAGTPSRSSPPARLADQEHLRANDDPVDDREPGVAVPLGRVVKNRSRARARTIVSILARIDDVDWPARPAPRVACGANLHRERPAVVHRLRRVVDEVLEDLPEEICVPPDVPSRRPRRRARPASCRAVRASWRPRSMRSFNEMLCALDVHRGRVAEEIEDELFPSRRVVSLVRGSPGASPGRSGGGVRAGAGRSNRERDDRERVAHLVRDRGGELADDGELLFLPSSSSALSRSASALRSSRSVTAELGESSSTLVRGRHVGREECALGLRRDDADEPERAGSD